MPKLRGLIGVLKAIGVFLLILAMGIAIILSILHLVGYDINKEIFEPLDKKVSSVLCSKQPRTSNWSSCENFTQRRINHYCEFSTKYKWASFKEKRACIPTNQEEQYLLRKYNWVFERENYTWEYVFPKSLYDYYKNKDRAYSQDYTIYATDPEDDNLTENLVDQLNDYGERQGLDKYEKVNFIISFVQGLPYTSDNVTTGHDEYPRYPVETLVDHGGDCEDTSILTAVLLNELNYGVVLLEFSNHMAVGVSCEPDLGTHYVDENNNTFCYLETSGENWEVGMIPEEYKNEAVDIKYIVPKPSLKLEWNSTGRANLFNSKYEINITVINEGSAAAKNMMIWAGFDTIEEKKVYDQEEIGPYTIEPNKKINKIMTLTVSRGKYTRLHILVSGTNFNAQESFSEWLTT